jgi:hypothetical protein
LKNLCQLWHALLLSAALSQRIVTRWIQKPLEYFRISSLFFWTSMLPEFRISKSFNALATHHGAKWNSWLQDCFQFENTLQELSLPHSFILK